MNTTALLSLLREWQLATDERRYSHAQYVATVLLEAVRAVSDEEWTRVLAAMDVKS